MASIDTVALEWDDENRPCITVRYKDIAGAEVSEVQADEWLVALAERLTDKSAKFLHTLIDLNEAREFVSLAELAVELQVDKKEADGWNRNLGRSIKAVVRDNGFLRPEHEDGTAQLFDYQWDQPNNLWRYAVPVKFRPVLVAALDER